MRAPARGRVGSRVGQFVQWGVRACTDADADIDTEVDAHAVHDGRRRLRLRADRR
ncbi:hypothetical protein ACFQZC_32350 [Streptacidiphilus monticola]